MTNFYKYICNYLIFNSSLLLCNKLKLQFKGTQKKPLPFNHELITSTHITLQILTF